MKRFAVAAIGAVLAFGASAGELIWRTSVADADEAAALLEKVRAGDALVITSFADKQQVAGLVGAYPNLAKAQVKKDSWRYPTLDVASRQWGEASFTTAERANCLSLKREGRGLVVITTEDGKREKFRDGLRRELALQNMRLRLQDVSWWDSDANGKRPRPCRGRGNLDVNLENLSAEAVEVSVELRLADADGRVRTHSAKLLREKSGRFSVKVGATLLFEGAVKATATLKDERGGARVLLREWDLSFPKYFSLKMPEYRGLVSTARREAAVHLSAAFDSYRRERFEGRPLSVTVTGPDGKEVAKIDRRFGPCGSLAFDVPLAREAAAGVYRVRAESAAEDGAVVRAEDTFKVVPVRKGQVFIDQDGGLLADGKPWFPFGIYHLSGTNDFDAVAKLGIDLIQAWPNCVTAENLRYLKGKGIRIAFETAAWPQVVNNWRAWRGVVPDCIAFETNAVFRAHAETVLAEPEALAFWYTADEAGSGNMDGIMRIHDYWQKLDPEDHPTYIVTTGDPSTAPAGEILGYDNYPRAFGAKRPMTGVADGIEAIYRKSPFGRCLIMVPQSFGHSAKHVETPEEFRCMSYLAMVHGVKGIFWYCWWDPDSQGAMFDPAARAAIKGVTDEAKAFKLALLAPGFVRLRSEDSRVHACLCGDETTGRFLIAVNGTDEPSDGVLESPVLKGLDFEPLYGSPAAKPTETGRLTVPLTGTERAVWRVR